MFGLDRVFRRGQGASEATLPAVPAGEVPAQIELPQCSSPSEIARSVLAVAGPCGIPVHTEEPQGEQRMQDGTRWYRFSEILNMVDWSMARKYLVSDGKGGEENALSVPIQSLVKAGLLEVDDTGGLWTLDGIPGVATAAHLHIVKPDSGHAQLWLEAGEGKYSVWID